MKVGLIQGQTFDVVLNEASQRKTASLVGFLPYKDQLEPYWGDEAVRLLTRKPLQVFKSPQQLLGKPFGHPATTPLEHQLRAPLENNEGRGTYTLRSSALQTSFAPEELVGLLLLKAQRLAEATSGSTVKDCVIAVPAFLTQNERNSVLDAASVAGLNVLSLINDGTAAAMNYGLMRDFSADLQRVIFFDMGAGSTRVTLVTLQLTQDKKNNTLKEIVIKDVGWDATLGGREIDVILTEYFAAKAAEKLHLSLKEITENSRAMAKLLRESNRIKAILSANQEVMFQVESLVDDMDFSVDFTRNQLENLVSHLFPRITSIFDQVLAANHLSAADIDFVEVIGGGVRMPCVQNLIKEYFNRNDLDRHVNADEAIVLGATFFAATKSTSFKVKNKLLVKDETLFPMSVEIIQGAEDVEMDKRRTQLIAAGNRVGSKRTLSFKSFQNFTLQLAYEDCDRLPLGTPKEVQELSVTGVPREDRYNYSGKPKIQAGFRISDSGIVSLESAEAEFTIWLPKPVQNTPLETKSTNTKDGNGSAEVIEDGDSFSEHEAENSTSNFTVNESVSASHEQSSLPSASHGIEFFKTVQRVKLNVAATQKGINALTEEERSSYRQRIQGFEDVKLAHMKADEAKSELEAFIYYTMGLLEEDDIKTVSTEFQRASLLSLLREASDWLYDDGENAPADEYKSQLSSLKEPADKILFRRRELTDRPNAAESLKSSISATRLLLRNVSKELNVTEDEVKSVEDYLTESEEWLHEKLLEQDKLQPHEDPAVTSKELLARERIVMIRGSYLLRKPKRERPSVNESTVPEQQSTGNSTHQETSSEHTTEEMNDGRSQDSENNQETTNVAEEAVEELESLHEESKKMSE